MHGKPGEPEMVDTNLEDRLTEVNSYWSRYLRLLDGCCPFLPIFRLVR